LGGKTEKTVLGVKVGKKESNKKKERQLFGKELRRQKRKIFPRQNQEGDIGPEGEEATSETREMKKKVTSKGNGEGPRRR